MTTTPQCYRQTEIRTTCHGNTALYAASGCKNSAACGLPVSNKSYKRRAVAAQTAQCRSKVLSIQYVYCYRAKRSGARYSQLLAEYCENGWLSRVCLAYVRSQLASGWLTSGFKTKKASVMISSPSESLNIVVSRNIWLIAKFERGHPSEGNF